MNWLANVAGASRAVIVFSLIVLGGCASAPRSGAPMPAPSAAAQIPVMLAAADRAIAKGDLAKAQSAYETILAAAPTYAEALLGLGEVQLQRGAAAAAVTTFNKVSAPASVPKALQGVGLALAELRRIDEAYSALIAATAQDPALWRSWTALGRLNDQRRDWKAAETAYTRALELQPGFAEIHNDFGVSMLAQRRYAEARAQFVSALEIDPGLMNAQANLRVTYAWTGEYTKALANAAPSEQPQVLNNVGYVAMERGDYTAAETLLSEAVRASPSFYKRANDNLVELRRRASTAQAVAIP